MDKKFYYLDKKEQKGPFTVNELKTFDLLPNTLVWTDEFENWKQLKDVEEFHFFSKTPPSPPIVDNFPGSIHNDTAVINNAEKFKVEASNIRFWIVFKIISFSILFLFFGVMGALMYSKIKVKNRKDEIYKKIDSICEGKAEVLDGVFNIPKGREIILNNDSTLYINHNPLTSDCSPYLKWKRDGFISVFEDTTDGFKIRKFKKGIDPDCFEYNVITSGALGFKTFSRINFSTNENRQVQVHYLTESECYTDAFNYLTNEDLYAPGAYTPGKFNDIKQLKNLENEYFRMESDFNGYNNYMYGNNQWSVFYSVSNNSLTLSKDKDAVNKDLYTYLGISIGFILLLLIIIALSKPKYFKNLRLYGNRWINSVYNEQIFIFEHSFFRKQIFTEIIDNKVYKGIFKIIDKGNTINLSYPNKELFYKIGIISNDNLSLLSLKDKTEIKFTRMGSDESPSDKNE